MRKLKEPKILPRIISTNRRDPRVYCGRTPTHKYHVWITTEYPWGAVPFEQMLAKAPMIVIWNENFIDTNQLHSDVFDEHLNTLSRDDLPEDYKRDYLEAFELMLPHLDKLIQQIKLKHAKGKAA